MSDEDINMNTDGLDKLLKLMKNVQNPVVKVGIIGSGDGRSDSNSNASIGAAHEYGSPANGLPQRSFLRTPISDNMDKKLKESDLLDQDTFNLALKDESVVPYLKKIGAIAKGIVVEAFHTSGYGKWAKWENSNYENNTGMVLVDTQQLRDSITWEVKE